MVNCGQRGGDGRGSAMEIQGRMAAFDIRAYSSVFSPCTKRIRAAASAPVSSFKMSRAK